MAGVQMGWFQVETSVGDSKMSVGERSKRTGTRQRNLVSRTGEWVGLVAMVRGANGEVEVWD